MRHDGDDDYGLPRVDVVVPDDARALDADLALWRREERRRIRQDKLRRIFRPFTAHGLAAPLIAGALVVALVSGALMTFFGPRSPDPRPTASMTVPTGLAGEIGGPLPDVEIVWQGRRHRSTELRPAVVLIVPTACDCTALLTAIAARAAGAPVGFYLVADSRRTGLSVQEAHARLAKDTSRITSVKPILVDDEGGVFATLLRSDGLTYVLVDRSGGIFDFKPGMLRMDEHLSVAGATI